MTNQQLINYYANLLILQYIGQPKAYATIQALVSPVIMNQLPLLVQAAFNMDGTAIGKQLDTLGKYAGVTRHGYSLSGAPITLSDADFLSFIKIAIVQNQSGSSLATIQAFIQQYFPGTMLVFDYQDMRMSYFLNTTVGSQNLAQMFVTGGKLPVPMSVQLSSVVYSNNITNLFGFRTYKLSGVNISPFNSYSSYSMTAPWLTYADGLAFNL